MSSVRIGPDPRLVYLDTSALVKIVVEETETSVLHSWIDEHPNRVSSIVTSIELRRAVRRGLTGGFQAKASGLEREADVALDAIQLLALDQPIVEMASRLDPATLRSLDAIHLATALSVDDLGAFVTYDDRLSDAATRAGLPVVAPGR